MEHVLVVDDEPALRRALRRLLEAKGYTVAEAESGEAALERVGAGGVVGVICDIVMPGLSGLDFYDRLVATDPALARRVVFLTGAAADDAVARGVEERGVPLLSKLYELDLAVDAVAIAILRRA
jgi:CheY-like chemotaxis protein